MLLKYFYDDKLAQASYMVGCQATGTAIVIDPARDIQPYLATAAENGMTITHVTETHIHADFVSGIRELAHATGATMLLSDEGDADWKYQFPDGDKFVLLHHGDKFKVGNVTFEVLHTPGHTPESITFMLTDNNADEPMGVFTGDFLFVGDIGRPDLLEEAAGIANTREPGARQQYANIEHFKTLPDYLQVWPAHGAGSACGKALGAVPSTTLGYEKRFNPAFQFDNEEDFVAWLLDGQPEAPRYFKQMKHINKVGAPLISELPTLQRLTGSVFDQIPTGTLVIDTRTAADFSAQHVQGTVNIPADSGGFNTYVGWYVDFDAPTYLIAYEDAIDEIISQLRAVGVDQVPGYFVASAVDFNLAEQTPQKTPQEIYNEGLKILDVRGGSEYASERIPNVIHIHMGYVPQRLDEIPRDTALAVHCGSGVRSQVVTSLLQAHGFNNVVNMSGGLDAWKQANLPIEQS
jgi:hydroxyacylglutathione hydrolase